MNGRDVILILAHLFRTFGPEVEVEKAVEFLSFKCHYGTPSSVRRLLTMALQREMITREGSMIKAAFIYNSQTLTPMRMVKLEKKVKIGDEFEPIV